jgi:hypothetical protein
MMDYQSYTVNEVGTITDPGKFEAERLYVPYFWEAYMSGCADTDDGEILGFRVEAQDIERFPELSKVEWVFLVEDDQGFVSEVSDGPRD